MHYFHVVIYTTVGRYRPMYTRLLFCIRTVRSIFTTCNSILPDAGFLAALSAGDSNDEHRQLLRMVLGGEILQNNVFSSTAVVKGRFSSYIL